MHAAPPTTPPDPITRLWRRTMANLACTILATLLLGATVLTGVASQLTVWVLTTAVVLNLGLACWSALAAVRASR